MSNTVGTVIIDIKADTAKLVDGMQRAEKAISKSVDSVKTNILRIGTAFVSIQTVMKALDIADSMNQLDARLKLATKSTEEFASQQKALLGISKDTRSGIQDITQLYVKLEPALKQLGASTVGVNKITSDFAKGLKLGGASASEASAATLQFAQAMGSGALRGDEFNSMAEASPKLMEYMAKGMGVPKTALRDLAAAGKLTAGEVSIALLKMSGEIDADFKTLPVTVGDAMVNIGTSTMLMVHSLDEASGVTKSLAKGLEDIDKSMGGYATSLENALPYIEGVGAATIIMYTSIKLAAITEGTYTKAKLISNLATASSTAIIDAQTKSNELATIAMELRAKAEAHSAQASILNTNVTKSSILALNKQALSAEAVALAANKNAFALTQSGTSATVAGTAFGFMGKALNSVPFIAVASTVALLTTAFFNATNDNNLLNDSLDTSLDKLKLLTSAQLEYRKILIQTALQEDRNNAQTISANLKKEKYGLFGGVPKKNEDTIRLASELDTINKAIEEKQNLLIKFNSILEGNAKGTDKTSDKTAEEIENIRKASKALEDKKALEEQLKKLQKASASEMESTAKSWASESIKLSADMANAQLGEQNKPYIDLMAKYDEEIAKYGKVVGAKELLDANYSANLTKLNNDSIANWMQKEFEKSKFITASEAEIAKKKEDALKHESDFAQTMQSNYMDSLAAQIDLASTAMDWQNGLTGVSGELAAIGKATSKMRLIGLKETEAQAKLDEKYSKQFEKYADNEAMQKELVNNYDKDQAKIKQSTQDQYISSFGDLAGAVAQYAEEGSAAAKVAEVAQKGLALVMGVKAVISAWGDQFPLNLVTVPATTIAVAGLLGSIGTSFGGGGGAGVNPLTTLNDSQQASMKATSENLDITYEPMLKKFDTQIGLLEKIEKNGSASRFSASQAKTQYEFDVSKYANEISTTIGGVREVDYSKNDITNMAIAATSFLRLQDALTKYGIDATGFAAGTHVPHKTAFYNNEAALNTSKDLLAYIAHRDEIEAERNKFLDGLVHAATDKFMTDAEFEKVKIDMAAFIGEFAIVLGDSLESLSDMSSSFQDMFDAITATTTYSTKRFMEANAEVNALLESTGASSLTSFMETQISGIDALERAYGEKVQTLLSDSYSIEEKAQVVLDLENLIGVTFSNGSEDALNYLDSINLVGEAMVASSINIKSWEDSFKTDQQIALDSIQNGVSTFSEEIGHSYSLVFASSLYKLGELFKTLSNDADGLTNADLEFLNANKAYLEYKEAETKVISDARATLQDQYDLLLLNGDAEAILARNRALTLESTDATNQALLSSIWIEEDRLKAIEEANASYVATRDNTLALHDLQLKLIDEQKTAVNNAFSQIESLINSVSSSFESTIETLRGDSTSSESSILELYKNISDAKKAIAEQDYESLDKYAQLISSNASVLMDSSNFASASEQKFAQLLTANSLQGMDSYILEQVDYLQLISEGVNALSINGVEANFKVGDNWVDVAAVLASAYNWNSADLLGMVQSVSASPDGKLSFDWDKNGIQDAVATIMPDGKTKLEFDWNNDGKVDITALANEDGSITAIKDNTLDTTSAIETLNTTMALYNQSLNDVLGVGGILELKDFLSGGNLNTADEIAFRQSFKADSATSYGKELEDLRNNLAYISLDTTDTSNYLKTLKGTSATDFGNIIEFFNTTAAGSGDTLATDVKNKYIADLQKGLVTFTDLQKLYPDILKLLTDAQKESSLTLSQLGITASTLESIMLMLPSADARSRFRVVDDKVVITNFATKIDASPTTTKNALSMTPDALEALLKKYMEIFSPYYRANPISVDSIIELPSYDVGSSYIPYDQVAQIHKGERILTAAQNIDFSKGFSGNPINSNGGVFKEMLTELKELKTLTVAQANEIKSMKKEMQDHTSILQDIEEKTA